METEKKPLVISKFAEGMTWEEVSKACGVSVSTIWRWAERDPEFKKAIKAAGEDADAEVEAVTYRNACDPDPCHNVLRMFWLNSRKGYKHRSDTTSNDESLAPAVFRGIYNARDDALRLRPPAPTNGVCHE